MKNTMDLNDMRGPKFLQGKWGMILATLLVLALLGGCNSDNDNEDEDTPRTYSIEFLSDLYYDGYVGLSPYDEYTVNLADATGKIEVGMDPYTSDEFRGFLAFDLRNNPRLPWDADIQEATLELYIRKARSDVPGTTIPLVMDLVSFEPPELRPTDFELSELPYLLSMPLNIMETETGYYVEYDVTSFLIETQYQELNYFQLRLVLNLDALGGFVEIADDADETAPYLNVIYR